MTTAVLRNSRSSALALLLGAALFAGLPFSAAHAEVPSSPPQLHLAAQRDARLLVLLPSATAVESSRGGRIGAEVLGGIVAIGASTAVTFATAYGLASACTPQEDFCGLGAAIMGGAVGFGTLSLSVPLGVTLAGDGSGGNGSYWASLLGSAAGAGAGLGLIWAVEEVANKPQFVTPVVVITGLALNLGGAILGYELSTHL